VVGYGFMGIQSHGKGFLLQMSYHGSDVFVGGDDTGVRKALLVLKMMSCSHSPVRNQPVATLQIAACL
jgi:hypothetical protein